MEVAGVAGVVGDVVAVVADADDEEWGPRGAWSEECDHCSVDWENCTALLHCCCCCCCCWVCSAPWSRSLSWGGTGQCPQAWESELLSFLLNKTSINKRLRNIKNVKNKN